MQPRENDQTVDDFGDSSPMSNYLSKNPINRQKSKDGAASSKSPTAKDRRSPFRFNAGSPREGE